MAFFVKLYDNNTSAHYLGVIEENDAAHFHAIGAIGDDGLFTQTDDSGVPVFNGQYHIKEEKIFFRTGVQAENGDYLLYGSMRTNNKNRNKNLVVRCDDRGIVQWAKTYTQSKTRFNIHMVKSTNDTYFMTSWLNVRGTSDDVEVIKIDGNGTVLNAVNIISNYDDQVNKLMALGSGVLVFGGTSAGPGWDNFMVAFDANLGVLWKKLIGASNFQEVRDVLQVDATNFIVTGETGGKRNSFVFNLDINQASHPVDTYDFVGGQEAGLKKLVKTASSYYLLCYVNSTKASFVAKFDLSLALLWLKELDLEDTVILRDLLNVGGPVDELLIGGFVQQVGNTNMPLLAYSDAELNSCSTVPLPLPQKGSETFRSADWNTVVKTTAIDEKGYEVVRTEVAPTELKICPSDNLDLGGNTLVQSPYIFLQAAGSDETDDSVKGFHLRWDLLRNLGETHLPKGDYSTTTYPTTIGYNRADDYVRIYKTEFKEDYSVEVNFSNAPDSLIESGATREWVYQNLVAVNTVPTNLTDVVIRFNDIAQYDALRTSIDPATNADDFIENYTGIIEAQTVGKFMFALEFTLGVQAQNQVDSLRLETVSLQDTLDDTTRNITCRKTLSFGNTDPLYCDNIEFIRFDYQNAYPKKLKLYAYDDFILGTNTKGDWGLLGSYALDDGNADSNSEVFTRLEDSANYALDGTWRKFNEPDVVLPGEFRVSVPNYQARWTMVEGLKEAVETYLDASKTDLTATVAHANNDPIVNDSEMDISYLDMLNFVSLDYHVARMLGLGHIDDDSNANPNKEYIYLMQYITEAQLEDEIPALTVQHFYMTPPLSIIDHKLPPNPVQQDITYGIFGENCGTGTPTMLTGPGGYNPYGPTRYINIHRGEFRYELPFEGFYASTEEFCLCEETQPVLMGLEYADDDPITPNSGIPLPFARPEINNDEDWSDAGGLYEVAPIPDTGENPVYIHSETTEGIHHYGLYSINWFSRVSQVGNLKMTDETLFPKLNTLLPPHNLGVQLIQPETPRIFTTQKEQEDLDLITTADETYVRVTFDWNEIQNQAYQTANGVQLFWREELPLVVQGELAVGPGSIVEDPVTHTVLVQTVGYLNASVNVTVTPDITSGDEPRFVAARLSAGGQSFVVDSVVTAGVNPSFRLKQIRQTASQEVNNDNVFCTTETWISPVEGERFLVTENLDGASSWDEQLAGVVDIVSHSNHSETVTYEDSTTMTFEIGGMIGSGVIADIPDPDPNIVANHVPGGVPTQVPTGVYTITYDTELLAPHPQSDPITDPDITVDYVGGSVRVHDINGEIKVLKVWKIEEVSSVTVLTAFDATFGLERDGLDNFILTLGQFTPVLGYTPIQLGAVPFVNFHPSYRAYVLEGTTLNELNTLPAAGEATKNTFIAVRSIDSNLSPTCESFMTQPAVLLAREIIEPVPPGLPTGPLFATRPNFFGKATYTFDVEVENPFSLIFFRANERSVLDQLYLPDTAALIVEELANLTSPDLDFYQDRWSDLVNMNFDPATNEFRQYVPGGYKFRIPNNHEYLIPHPNTAVQETPFDSAFTFADNHTYIDPDLPNPVVVTMIDVVKEAIDGAFLPLTENPPLYKQLQELEFQTSGRPPAIRHPQTLDRLTTDDPEFDPWPMAFRYEKDTGGNALQDGDAGYGAGGNTKFVRFTDYTLDGAAQNFYFYFAVELASNLTVSDRSGVAGPIQLVNAQPAQQPEIRKITSQLKSTLNDIPTAVVFELNEYLKADNIKQIQVYRTTAPEKSLSVRTMDLVKTVNVGEQVIDDFENDVTPLYGDPLFYRVVAFREITNEQGVTEMVPSKPSNVAMTNIVDNINPLPPSVSYNAGAPINVPIELPNVSLSWNKTAHNATYYIYKQNSAGNWTKIRTYERDEHSNAAVMSVDLLDTDFGVTNLVKQDDDLNTIYHRFRVDVENSSGLLNLTKDELTV